MRIAIVSLLMLSACSGSQLASTAAIGTAAVTPAVASHIARQCQALQPVFVAGAQAGNGVASSSARGALGAAASFGNAFCGSLASTGTLPPTADADTPKWLLQVERAERVLAPIAQVLLPLALSAI